MTPTSASPVETDGSVLIHCTDGSSEFLLTVGGLQSTLSTRDQSKFSSHQLLLSALGANMLEAIQRQSRQMSLKLELVEIMLPVADSRQHGMREQADIPDIQLHCHIQHTDLSRDQLHQLLDAARNAPLFVALSNITSVTLSHPKP